LIGLLLFGSASILCAVAPNIECESLVSGCSRRLPVGSKYYPESARAGHEEGTCIIQASVGGDGKVNSTTTAKSTGFSDLDHACVEAISHARFSPERQDGQPVADSTYIAIYWHLQ